MNTRRRLLVAGLVLSVILGLPGCAYKIYVRGVLETEHGPTFPREVSINVQRDPDADDPSLNNQIALKIEKLLAEQGYTVASEEEASLILFFEYDREGLLERRSLEPISGPASGIMTTRREGPFIHTLAVSVIDAESYRDAGVEAADLRWAGGAVLNGTPIYGPKIVDMLLVAAFERFGQDTQRTLETGLYLGDRRVKRLRLE